ncbi:hypothetical protein [Myroides odoratimimus]|uniref:hypothetical protein n=1 Tax=Myroides odoratimimus TaxID=76832 RepID=UPI0025750728|nr:hypothetical protein [Myroides odoratimimus]MDM1499642.1 hypothetical protein [Myroides odoratimimus]
MIKKEYSKTYFTHLLLNRLETQNRKGDLRFFRPSLFKMLYRTSERNFVNDILLPHVETLKIYYFENDNKRIQFTTYKEVQSIVVHDSVLTILLNNKLYTVYTPINKNRDTLLIENFTPLELNGNDLSLATIDHFPSLIDNSKVIQTDVLYTYIKDIRKNAKPLNPNLKTKIIENKQMDRLWQDLQNFYKNSPIELVHSKYNNREGR